LLPRLTDRLQLLENQLDELEREENVRLRWAAGTRDGGRA
jgi:vacuolar-type H+-ATPase subunit D/Vma8